MKAVLLLQNIIINLTFRKFKSFLIFAEDRYHQKRLFRSKGQDDAIDQIVAAVPAADMFCADAGPPADSLLQFPHVRIRITFIFVDPVQNRLLYFRRHSERIQIRREIQNPAFVFVYIAAMLFDFQSISPLLSIPETAVQNMSCSG